jgi:hypothetical protein
MELSRTTKVLLTITGGLTAVLPILADVNATHLFNPAWAPHARYHGWVFLTVNLISGLTALALIWGRFEGARSALAVRIAALLPAMCWGPQLLAMWMPGASSWPDGVPQLAPIAGNVVLSAVLLVLCAIAVRSDTKARALAR